MARSEWLTVGSRLGREMMTIGRGLQDQENVEGSRGWRPG